jgi:hypothetical protein
MPKNRAAQSLAKLRWTGVTAEERLAQLAKATKAARKANRARGRAHRAERAAAKAARCAPKSEAAATEQQNSRQG